MSTTKQREWFSVPQAADYLDLTEGRVRQLLRVGSLGGEKLNGKAWMVHRETLRKFKAQDRPAGNPNLQKNSA